MMKYRNTNRKSIAEINIVPYVDVMLVLLIIFMVTAPLIQQGVDVQLPEASAMAMTTEKTPIVVTVDHNQKLYLNISDSPNKEIDAKDLQVEVIAALQIDPKRPVLIKGDKRVDYNTVVNAMVLLQKSGVSNIGLETSESS